MVIPKKLQQALPYKLKPKNVADVEDSGKEKKRKCGSDLISRHTAVILEPEESRVHDLMNGLFIRDL